MTLNAYSGGHVSQGPVKGAQATQCSEERQVSRKYAYSLLRRNQLLLLTQQPEKLKRLPLPPRLQPRVKAKKHQQPFSDLGKEVTGIGVDTCSCISLCQETQLLKSTTHCWSCCLPHSSWPSVDLDVKPCFKNPTKQGFCSISH